MKIIIIAVIILTARLVQNLLSANRASSNFNQASSDKDYAISFAETLDLTVAVKRNVDTQVLKNTLANLNLRQLKNFTVKSIQQVEPDTFLCITLVEYEDVEYLGKQTAILTNALDLNFKILLDHENKTCRFYSDLHSNLTDKMLREEFVSMLWDKLIETH